MKDITKGQTGSVLFCLWFTCAGSWQEFLLFLEEAAFSKSAVFMAKVPNFYGFHYKKYFLIRNFTQKYVIFHRYLQLRKLKWWTLMEKLVWVCLWRSRICCSYRYFQVSFKPGTLVLPAIRRLCAFSCGFCNPPRIRCCKWGSTSRTQGNTGCGQTAPRVCLLRVPLGLETGCSHSGSYEDRWQGEVAYLWHASKSHREWGVLLQIVLILTEKTDPDLAWGARVTPITPMSDLSWVTSNLQYFLKLQHSAIIKVGLGV